MLAGLKSVQDDGYDDFNFCLTKAERNYKRKIHEIFEGLIEFRGPK